MTAIVQHSIPGNVRILNRNNILQTSSSAASQTHISNKPLKRRLIQKDPLFNFFSSLSPADLNLDYGRYYSDSVS